MSGCSNCDPLKVQGHGCPLCKDWDGSVRIGASTTSPTSTESTASPASVESVSTDSLKNGTSPYLSILADILNMLHGKDEFVYVTPLMQMAVMAIELELADRLLDETYEMPSAAPVH